MREFYSQFIRAGDLVFDIGANRGDRTEVFVQMGARVVAAEPQPALAARLRTIFRYSPVNVEAAGIGRAAGTLPLHVCSTDTVSSFSDEFVEARSKENLDRQWDRVEMVPIVTVDTLIGKYGLPAFVKIDVEGFEGEVLAGLSQTIPALSFEVHPDDSTGHLSACLARLDSLSPLRVQPGAGRMPGVRTRQWVDSRCLMAGLREIPVSKWTYGDVYARRRDVSQPGRVGVVYGNPPGVGGLGHSVSAGISAAAKGAREVFALGPARQSQSWSLPTGVPQATWIDAPVGEPSWVAQHIWRRWRPGRGAWLRDRDLGQWAAGQLPGVRPDACYLFTQVALESLRWCRQESIPTVLDNPNGHIRNFREVCERESRAVVWEQVPWPPLDRDGRSGRRRI